MSGDSSLDLGPVEDFPTGRYRLFEVGRREIGVVRLADGSVHAVLNRCPHRGAPVCRGTVTSTLLPSDPDDLTIGYEGEIVRCPWHGYEFSVRSGECLFIGGGIRLHTFPAAVRDGRVHVEGVPARVARAAGRHVSTE
ncbi:nitrite reductase (NADH) small subunit [Constrictibacter sp. MBR-5]|jgi:nitrite reductase/ring-hydroxylating ferredoxin subunit|uniref:Rieske (2Fe-2S) protein n=1 Tax=Constrictibacter sp. MBR-5 TaxID=3156467 RepID=UPI003396E41B